MNLIKTTIGRLRIIGFLEGSSLLLLLFAAMPLKYIFDNPSWVKAIGPVHGALFVLFVMYALGVSVQKNWGLKTTTMVIFISSFIPFGTFYVDSKILSKNED